MSKQCVECGKKMGFFTRATKEGGRTYCSADCLETRRAREAAASPPRRSASTQAALSQLLSGPGTFRIDV